MLATCTRETQRKNILFVEQNKITDFSSQSGTSYFIVQEFLGLNDKLCKNVKAITEL